MLCEGGQRLTSLPVGLNQQVLVLNKAYAAIRVVSARRAFTLLAKHAAEIIALEGDRYINYDFATWTELSELQQLLEPEQHSWIRTPRLSIAIPNIVRLYRYDKFPSIRPTLNRRNIYARDHNLCQYCGIRFTTRELTLDHVVPRVQGGVHSWENLVCACVDCNRRKGGRTPQQARMRLVKTPREPSRPTAQSLRVAPRTYRSWRAFLNDAYWNVELND